MDPELWSCLDCFHEGHLTIHGACERCGSQAVVVPYETPYKTPYETSSGTPDSQIFGMVFRPLGDELPDGTVHHWWSFRFYVKNDEDPDKRTFGHNEDLSK